MPTASYGPPRPVTGLDDGVDMLRAAGHRVSASRLLTLEGLLAADGPVSAEYLAGGLGGRIRSSDLPSAYRNLELFERLGMTRHVHIGHGPGLYALVTAEERAYAVCERCGRLSRIGAEEVGAIRERVRNATGFEAHFSHFPILGLCGACAALPSMPATEGEAMTEDVHSHDDAHAHEHSHGDETHSHAHDTHEHEHVEHEHEHSHGDHVHSHPHVHQEGLEGEHEHGHDDED